MTTTVPGLIDDCGPRVGREVAALEGRWPVPVLRDGRAQG
jgi:hypothetical protein